MKLALWLATASLSTTTLAEVIDLGSLDQYKPKTVRTEEFASWRGLLKFVCVTNGAKDKIPPGIHENGLWVTEADGGVSLIPGSSVAGKINDVLGKCESFDGQCYNDLTTATKDMWVQTDPKISVRQISQGFRLLTLVVGFFAIIGGEFQKATGKTQKVELGSYIPQAQASKFPALKPGATVTISGDGSAIATITQPATTAIQVSATPSVSVVTEAKDGFEEGDLDVQLSTELADELNRLFKDNEDSSCKDGEAFGGQTKRGVVGPLDGILPGHICKSEEVVQQASEVLMMDVSKIHFDLSDTISKSKEAVVVLSNFIKDYSPLLAAPLVQPPDELAVIVLAMVLGRLAFDNPFGNHNRIKGALLAGEDDNKNKPSASASATSSGSCPRPTELPCGMEDKKDEKCGREIKRQGPGDYTTVCKDGDHKGCECVTMGYGETLQASEDFLQLVLDFAKVLGDTSEEHDNPNSPECEVKPTGFQSELFYSKKQTVVEEYCREWNKNADFKATVNAKGEIQGPRLRGRTPPANADDMGTWRVDLEFKKSDKGGECSSNCHQSYERFMKACTTGSGGLYMFPKGTFDVGCGTFSYSIYDTAYKPVDPEPPKPEQKEPDCYNAPSAFPAAIFSSDKNKMYLDFCGIWNKDKGNWMAVNPEGYRILQGKRDEPSSTNPKDWGAWRANLDYTVNPDGGECTMTCEEAYDKLGNTCRKDNTWQYRQGTIDAGCGWFRYHLYEAVFDPHGSSECKRMWLDHCDNSKDHLEEQKLYSSDGGKEGNGHCRGNANGWGCGTFLQATKPKEHNCQLYGYEMKNLYHALREDGAKMCGSVHYADGCLFTVNRVHDCAHLRD